MLSSYCFAYLATAKEVSNPIVQDSQELKYQQALSLNKSEQYSESALLLKALMLSFPDSERYRTDYIAVASNAQMCQEVFKYATLKYLVNAPNYAKDAVVACPDGMGMSGINIQSELVDFSQLGKKVMMQMTQLALSSKKESAALYWSRRAIIAHPKESEVLDQHLQILWAFDKKYELLQAYINLESLKPNDRHIQEKISILLLDIGAPHLAISRMNRSLNDYSPEQKLRAMGDVGAFEVRWADADSYVPPNRFHFVDQSINDLKVALDYAHQTNAATFNILKIKSDLIVAYEKRKDWKKGIDLYESLIADGFEVPSYAKLSAANCYQGNQAYIPANVILQELFQGQSQDVEVMVSLYFNWIELDNYKMATVMLQNIQSVLKSDSINGGQAPITYSTALIYQAYLQAYQDRNQQAIGLIDDLLGKIPANNEALNAAGNISRWQDNPMRAEEYFQIVLNQDPNDLDAKLGFANARMDQEDYPFYKSSVHKLQSSYGDVEGVQKAVKRLSQYESPYITGNFEIGDGYYQTQANKTWTGDLRGYSKIIDDNFRGFARYRGLYSGPVIESNIQGIGGGVQYLGVNRAGEIELGNMGYSRIEGSQIVNDQWSTGASYERNAFYLLPGALYANIAGNVTSVNLKWKNNDTTQSVIGYRYWTFDNNIKQETYGSITQRVLTEYNYKLDLTGWIGNQSNTNPDVGYFAPASQTEYSGTVSLKILQWRDLATKTFDFWHRFYISYGQVTQASYSTLPMNSYGYGQEFKFGEGRTLAWGIGRTSFPFDGVVSSYLTGYLNFKVHF